MPHVYMGRGPPMKKEPSRSEGFNLSEKIRDYDLKINKDRKFILRAGDVKEFIRLLKEELSESYKIHKMCSMESIKIIDKLAGKKLSK